MAYQIQIEIGGNWECCDWEETEAGERVEYTHATEAEAQAELADMFSEMEAQGMDFARDDWRVAEVASKIYIQMSDCGQHIRKWSAEPFEGATRFESKGEAA